MFIVATKRVIDQVFKRRPSVGSTATNGYEKVPSGRLLFTQLSEVRFPEKAVIFEESVTAR